MPKWSNWSGKHVARPEALHFVRSEEDARAILKAANGAGRQVRVAGTGHSHAPLIPTSGDIIDLSGMAGVLETNPVAKSARILAGTKLHALGAPLHRAGLALINQGDIDRQALAGAVGTGTHGTGRTLGNFSSAVRGFTLLTAKGERLECNAAENKEIWQAARLNLGAFGLITEFEMQLREAYRLEEKTWQEPLPQLLERLETLNTATRHFEFFWYPETDEAFAKSLDETAKAPIYPLGDEGSRCGWSYEVLPSHRPHLHTEMEYSVPEETAVECLLAIRSLIQKDFEGLKWPVEYRTLAADDVWLSTAYERPTVTISVHQGIDQDDAPLFRACEEVFRTFEGRPHWGKVHYLDGEALMACHPKWKDWWKVRDALDPKGTFLNDHLLRVRPG